jgi:peroxiredoxin
MWFIESSPAPCIYILQRQAELKVGDKLADYSDFYRKLKRVPAGDMKSLADYNNGKPLVVFFYPKADTPGCTKEACKFRDDYAIFKVREQGGGAEGGRDSRGGAGGWAGFLAPLSAPFLLQSSLVLFNRDHDTCSFPSILRLDKKENVEIYVPRVFSTLRTRQDAGAEVVGISGDDVAAQGAFQSKHRLPFDLLCDANNFVRKDFGIKSEMLGLLPGRVTYVIDKQGVCRMAFTSMLDAEMHVKQAVEMIKKL